MKKAYLYLENGQVLEGRSFGAVGTAMGELVFTTGMTGCVESLTDPSYYGQLVVYTFPQFGNYGICRADQESPHCQMGGVVVREACENPSNFRCEETVDAFLKEENVVGIAGVDTRMLTQMIRDGGVLNAVITTEEGEPDWDALKAYRVKESVENTSRKDILVRHPEGEKKFSVALLDYGAKGSICNSLLARGCEVTIYPYNTPAEDILAAGHDGVMLSNGPGDPADNVEIITEVRKLYESELPLFAVCLGHQLLALATGAETRKMRFGHRGGNHPVKDLEHGRAYITSQNHGYVVTAESVDPAVAEVSHINVNEGSVEGLRYRRPNCFTVQFHPEAAPGPMDTEYLFDRFVDSMKGGRAHA